LTRRVNTSFSGAALFAPFLKLLYKTGKHSRFQLFRHRLRGYGGCAACEPRRLLSGDIDPQK
jgi:hypothetical protein